YDGIRRWFDSFYEVMDEIRWDAHSFQEAGEMVIVVFTLRARGKTTGLDFGQDAVMLWELRDGKAIRLELFATLGEAQAAAGEGAAGRGWAPRATSCWRKLATPSTRGIPMAGSRPGARTANGTPTSLRARRATPATTATTASAPGSRTSTRCSPGSTSTSISSAIWATVSSSSGRWRRPPV